MKIGILGTGLVGRTLAGKLASLGHDLVMGTREVAALTARREPSPRGGQSFADWHGQNQKVKLGTFAEAAAHGELLINATSGSGALSALRMAGEKNFDGKVLIDVSNPLDFSHGMPPTLLVSNTDSLGEQVQRALPRARVVKTLNTMNAILMVEPRQLADGDHAVFVSGNDVAAKKQVTEILTGWFGWKQVIDLGDISTARGAEMILPLWVRLMGALGGPRFNFKIVQ
jgi:8-hydroxy-5-deazaflavin:NADPH oxidoreductase